MQSAGVREGGNRRGEREESCGRRRGHGSARPASRPLRCLFVQNPRQLPQKGYQRVALLGGESTQQLHGVAQHEVAQGLMHVPSLGVNNTRTTRRSTRSCTRSA